MKQIILIFIYVTAAPFIINAQEKEILKSTNFYSTVSAGYLLGESGVFPGAQISSGINFKNLKLGIGGGYDGYRFKSFPIFAGISRDFGRTKKIIVFFNGGYHFPKSEETYEIWSFPQSENWKGGLYVDAGLGFRIKLGEKNNLLVSSSYNYKKIRHIRSYVYPCLTFPCPVTKSAYDYGLNYISLDLGWEINY